MAVLLLGLFVGYLFGFDVGYEGGARAAGNANAVSELSAVMQAVVGDWQSTSDAKFARSFKADGTAVDSYDGKTDMHARWTAFTSEVPHQSYTGTMEDGAAYLALEAEGESPLFFRITKLNATELELLYLDRGGTLTFTRVSQ